MEATAPLLTRHQLGVQATDTGFTFSVWAPHAVQVYLVGDFNDWKEKDLKLQKAERGCWSVEVESAKVGDEYQFLIETPSGDLLYRNDPHARMLTNSDGNSIITVDDYDWESDDFEIADWNQLVIYELHIGTFNVKEKGQPGTFASAIEKLPHLKDLGINAVEVMPINEFAGDYSWGYNPAFPYAVEEAYGGVNGFKDFVKAAHEHGIAVILDVVYNHFGPSDLDLWQFDGWHENDKGGIYFYNDWRSDTPWGDTRPDYGREEVRQYIFDNALMWLEEFRCDGLRMDMVPYIRSVSGAEDDVIDEGFSLLMWINSEIGKRHPRKLVIAEDLHGNDFITDSTQNGGCGFGAQWDADFVHPVREVVTTVEDDHRDLHKVMAALQKTYNGDAFNRVIYTESHDEVANGQARVTEEIADEHVSEYFSKKRSTLGAALVMTSPGIPMLFQGQELLEDKWFSDQDPIDWKRLEKFCGVHRLYRDLIHLRRNSNGRSAGLTGSHTRIVHVDHNNKVLVFLRWLENAEQDGVLVVLNFKNLQQNEYQFSLPLAGDWHLLFNSDWNSYGDHTQSDQEDNLLEIVPENEHLVRLSVPAYACLIYSLST